jgi:hypothetical protein
VGVVQLMPSRIFNPLCLNKHDGITPEGYAHTAEGFIVPCCHVDCVGNKDEPLLQALLKEKLKVSNNESISDILASEEWREFGEAVIKGYEEDIEFAPPCCLTQCAIGGRQFREVS